MKRKNFTSLPNDFLLDEKKEHNANQLLKNATEKLIVLVFEGLQAKFGPDFQKSEKQIANMCLVARSTFNKNIENLINKGVITKRVTKKEGSKENDASYWTLNLKLDFEFELENDVVANSDNVQNDTTTQNQNDTTVVANSDNGCPNIGQKKDLKDLKDLREEENNNIYNSPRNLELINFYLEQKEIIGMSEILTEKGFNHGTIKEIQNKTALNIVKKEIKVWHIKHDVIETAIIEFNKDKNNNIRSSSGLFVFKLKQAIENKNIEYSENNRKLEAYNDAL